MKRLLRKNRGALFVNNKDFLSQELELAVPRYQITDFDFKKMSKA
jgi:hypothetical protein